MKKLRNIGIYTFFIGAVCIAAALFLPYNILASIFGPLKLLGVTAFYVCPALGVIGFLASVINKRFFISLLNVFLVFALPIICFFIQSFNIGIKMS